MLQAVTLGLRTLSVYAKDGQDKLWALTVSTYRLIAARHTERVVGQLVASRTA